MSNNNNSEFIRREELFEIAKPDEVLPDTLQLIPLSFRPYFPVLVRPIVLDQEPWGLVSEVSLKPHISCLR